MNPMLRIAAALVAAVLIAGGCGGSSDEPDTAIVDDTTVDAADITESADPADPDETQTDPVEAGETEPTAQPTEAAGGAADQDLVASLDLPACPVGAHLDAGAPVEISLWHPYTALTAEAMEDLATAFNASQGNIVVTVEAQGDYGELLAKYRESISFDDLPAVAITDLRAFREMVDSETVLPAQSCIEAEGVGLDALDELVRAFVSVDGAMYPGALLVSTPVLYYNRDHFEAAGLDPDGPPTTLAELQDAAQAIQDAGVADTPLSLLMSGWYVETWLHGAGVSLVNADNGRSGPADAATFNGPEALELYRLLAEMNDAGLIVPFSNTPGQVGHYLAGTGDASMIIATSTASTTIAGVLGGTANLSELVAQAGLDGDIVGATDLAINIDVAPMPGLREPGQVFVSGGAFYMTDLGSDAEKAAAWEFLKFVNEVEQQKVVHLKGSYLPINPGVVEDPDVQRVWETDAAGRWLQTAYGQLADIDRDFPGPAVGPFTEQRDAFEQSLEALLLGDVDPGDALAEAEATLNEALEDYADANF